MTCLSRLPPLTRCLPEVRRRLLAHGLTWVASAEYKPRQEALAEALGAIAGRQSLTLHGCQLTVARGSLRIGREYNAVKARVAGPGAVWDGRWVLSGPEEAEPEAGLEVRALGEAGLAACPDWRVAGVPRSSALALPGVWNGADLVAAPLAGRAAGWRATLLRGETDYYCSILSH